MKYLKLADQFGATFQPYIGGDKDSQFRTYIGGLTSISVYAVSLLYLMYECYLWQTNQLIPVISTTQVNFDQIQHQIQNNEIILTSSAMIGQLDPFNPKSQILVPVGYFDGNWEFLQQVNGSFLQFNSLNVNTLGDGSSQTLLLVNCSNYWETSLNITCASEQARSLFFSLVSQLQLNLTLQKYDTSKQQMTKFTKIFKLNLDPNLSAFQTLIMQTAVTQANLGFIFPLSQSYDYLYDFQMIIQSFSEGYLYNFFTIILLQQNATYLPIKEVIPVSIIQFEISNVQYQSVIQYPLLGTILAQVGSIYSLLLLSAKLINMLNSVLMEEYLVDQIIGYYYPEFKKIEIKESICGKNIIVRSKDKKIYYDPKEIGEIYKKSQKIAFAKLNYLNIIYEISRIQFILQSLQDRDILNKSHEIGIRLPLNIINQDNNKVKVYNLEDELINQNLTENQQLKINQNKEILKTQQPETQRQLYLVSSSNEQMNPRLDIKQEQNNKYKFIDSDMLLFTLIQKDDIAKKSISDNQNLFMEQNIIK